jgi:hypothetical protein
MYMICTDNDGFEDQLTVKEKYTVKGLQGGSVEIENDRGEIRWYGTIKFGHGGNE